MPTRRLLTALIAFAVSAFGLAATAAAQVRDPVVVYTEDFENGVGATPQILTDYTGAGGQTYTADAPWLANCNGVTLEFASPDSAQGASGCAAENSYSAVRQLAYALGVHGGAVSPQFNHAVAAYTEGNPGADLVEFETVDEIPLATATRFLTFQVDTAALNCTVSPPLYQFFLISGADATPVGGTVNACTSATTVNVPAIGTFPAGPARVGSYTSDGAILFSGSSVGIRMRNANGSGLGNDAAFDNIRILDATPSMQKSFSPSVIPAGGVSTATFTIWNTSELAAKPAWTFTDSLPDGVTVAATPNASTTCTGGAITAPAGSGSISVSGNLDAGQASCTVSVDITSTVAGTHTNIDVDGIGIDPPPPADITVIAPDLSLEKTSSATVAMGEQLTWTLTVTNHGFGDSSGFTVEDTLPAGITDATTDTPGCSVTGGTLQCTGGPLAEGESTEITVTGTVSSYSPRLVNNATVRGNEPDPDPSNNDDDTDTEVTPPDLSLEKTAPGIVEPGGQITWTLTVTNHGPGTSSGYMVQDVLPPEVTNASTSTPGCTISGGTVECDGGPLAAGESDVITITATAPTTSGTRIANHATVTGDEPDPDPSNNTDDEETFTPGPPPALPPAPIRQFNLSLEKTASRAQVVVGDEVTYRLVARNAGPDAAIDPTVTDTLPSRLRLRSASTSQGSCTTSGNTVDCRLGTIAAGQSVTVTVRAVALQAGGVANSATLTPPPGSPIEDPGDNTATASVRVVKPLLTVSKRSNKTTLRAGETATYTIRVRNPSKHAVRNVRTCDRLPAGLVYVRSVARARLSGGQYCWTARTLGAGKSVTYRITVRALTGTSGAKVNRVTAGSPDARTARATRTVRVTDPRLRPGGVTG